MTTAIITHKDFALHDTGSNHPESPDRVISIINTLKKVKSKKIEWVEAPKTNLENIYKVHSKEFVKKIGKHDLKGLSEDEIAVKLDQIMDWNNKKIT